MEATKALCECRAIESSEELKNRERLEFSIRGANARHAENRAMKEHVFNWCDKNMLNFSSMDNAAEEVARKEVKVAFRTARSWIGQWKKERSASTT